MLHMRGRRLCRVSLEACILRRTLTIKHNADLLQGDRLGLGVGKVNHQDLENDDHAYDDIVSGDQSA